MDTPFVTPLFSLRDFTRIDLKSSESQQVRFTLKPEDFLLFNDEGKEIRYGGKFKITVAGAAPVEQAVQLGGAEPVSIEVKLI
jgi:beta-glucosidase